MEDRESGMLQSMLSEVAPKNPLGTLVILHRGLASALDFEVVEKLLPEFIGGHHTTPFGVALATWRANDYSVVRSKSDQQTHAQKEKTPP
ncbi:hypothetical protein GCM10022631_12620 [Deinococcus rubellus]